MLKVYGDALSGNCYKVRLVLENLSLAYEWQHVDILKGESRTPEYLAMNPNGKVPLLEIDGKIHLPESNAILCYLADGSPLLASERLARAQTLAWLFFEQYSHEPYIAVARYIVRYLGRPAEQESLLQQKMKPGYAALDVMERHLSGRSFMVGGCYGIADIALYAYTHVAHEGGFDLARYPATGEWLDRVRAQPGHVAIGPAAAADAS